ncbi:MAG TPA: hypothetical protein VLJ42_05895 [Solirubrobacteraceae bacterium]|nr:hypothetical protein [Solirubrobacteraceae bacterium]
MASAALVSFPVLAHADALPDGRAYELVSPAIKNGNDAGAPNGTWQYGLATADGDGVLYASRGAMGEATRGLQEYTVGRRGRDGWSARSALPYAPRGRLSVFGHYPVHLLPSADLSKLVFSAAGTYFADNPDTPLGISSGAVYLYDSAGNINWLTRPQISNPSPAPGSIDSNFFQDVGGSDDLSTLYFWGYPTLLASDAARTPEAAPSGAWGLYEYSGGTLKSAGTLPDGSESPGGAAPASSSFSERNQRTNFGPEMVGNQVSRDASTLFFVSPDPGLEPRFGPVTQLYVRHGGHSRLISHLPGDPDAEAPHGVRSVFTLNGAFADPQAPQQFAFASPDGSSAVFQSIDALTSDAPPDSSQKAYRYDMASGVVTYLPRVGGGTVVAASDDGQRFLFNEFASGSAYIHIDLWDHGTVKTLTPVSNPVLAPARATASGSAFTFTSKALIPGVNNGGADQVYRYDVAADKLICLSCPSDGVTATGASLVNQARTGEVREDRGMSEDGHRVFFQTGDALVSQDTNHQQDVYEWTPAGVSLISSGRSQNPSFVIDNSASGNDVFFATTEGLYPKDTDGSYDVYDARVGGGFKPVDQAAPCEGDACQGGVLSAPSLLTVGSAGFLGAGNGEPPGVPAVVVKKVVKCRSGYVKKSVRGKQVCVRKPKRGAKQARARLRRSARGNAVSKLSRAIDRSAKS